MWAPGRQIDRVCSGGAGRETAEGSVSVDTADPQMSPETLVALYHQGAADAVRIANPHFLSGAVDKSRVHCRGGAQRRRTARRFGPFHRNPGIPSGGQAPDRPELR